MPFADLLVSVSGALHDWLKNGRQGAGQVRNLLGNNIFWDSSIQNDTIHDNDLLKMEKLFLCVFAYRQKLVKTIPVHTDLRKRLNALCYACQARRCHFGMNT